MQARASKHMQRRATPQRVCMRGTLLPDDATSAAAAAVILMSALCMPCVIMAQIMPLSRLLLAFGAWLRLPQMSRLCRRRIFGVTVNNVMRRCQRPPPPRSHSYLCACVALCFVSSDCSASKLQQVFKRRHTLLFYSYFIVFILLCEAIFVHLSPPPHY